MVEVRAVRVLVDSRIVAVRVAVLAVDRNIVVVIVVSVIVAMRVLVLQRLVLVAVRVALREVEVDRDAEQECGAGRARPRGSLAERPRHRSTHEGRDGENGARSPSTNGALRAQVEPQADAVAGGAAREQRE